jgi:hypothetical protein
MGRKLLGDFHQLLVAVAEAVLLQQLLCRGPLLRHALLGQMVQQQDAQHGVCNLRGGRARLEVRSDHCSSAAWRWF